MASLSSSKLAVRFGGADAARRAATTLGQCSSVLRTEAGATCSHLRRIHYGKAHDAANAALAERGGYYMRCCTSGPYAIPDWHRSRQRKPNRRQAPALPKRAVVVLTIAAYRRHSSGRVPRFPGTSGASTSGCCARGANPSIASRCRPIASGRASERRRSRGRAVHTAQQHLYVIHQPASSSPATSPELPG